MRLSGERWAYFGVLGGIAAVLFILLKYYGAIPALQCQDVTADKLQNLLFTLLLITTFKERAQEIYVIAWRQEGRSRLLQIVDSAPDKEGKHKAELELSRYRAKTGRYVSLVSLCSGVFISLAGVRVLSPLVTAPSIGSGQAGWLFVVDVLLTGGLLAGGSKMIHEVMAVVSEALGKTRQSLATPPGQSPTPAQPPAQGQAAPGAQAAQGGQPNQ